MGNNREYTGAFVYFAKILENTMKAITWAAALGLAVQVYAFDNLDPATTPPAGLDTAKVPLFISLGFDDNKYADGVDWVRDTLLKGRFNHEGAGNRATYDGTPMAVDFFVIGNADYPWAENPYNQPVPSSRPVTKSWKTAYMNGQGINNHTWTHQHNLSDLQFDQSSGELPSLLTEIGMCSKYLINIAGIPYSEIYGLRTPYLASSVSNNLSFKATSDLGMLYDCTLDNGMQGNAPKEWAYPYWPGTMNNGWIWYKTMATEGLWQMPNAIYQVTENGTFSDKGFDSGPKGWPGGASGDAMFKQMKSAIEWAYKKNRAAVDLGLHSDYYSAKAQATSGTAASNFSTGLTERQGALIQLLDWIEAELPDARVVTKIDVIRWMRNPVTLDDLSRNAELTFNPSNGKKLESGEITVDGNGSDASKDGNSVTVTVKDTKGNWKIDGYAGVSYPVSSSLDGYHSIRVTYKSDIALQLVLVQDGLDMNSYSYGLATTDGKERTVELPLSASYFDLPRPYSSDAEMNLKMVEKIALVANVMDTTMNGSFTADIEIFNGGVGVIDYNTLTKSEYSFSILAATEHKAALQIPTAGNYEIKLFSLNGRQLFSTTNSFESGYHTLEWKQPLAKGVYVAHIIGAGSEKKIRFAVK